MKSVLLFLLVAVPAYAQVFTARIDASSTNIPTSYAGSHGAVVFPGGNPKVIDALMIDGTGLASEVNVDCNTTANVAPADADGHVVDVQAGLTWALPDFTGLGNACYVRSLTGSAISTGILIITVIGN